VLHFYEIAGTDRAELLHQLNRLGPKGFHAHAEWNVHYDYLRGMRDGRCSVLDVTTAMTGEITLPRWSGQGGAPHELVEHWRRYEAALRAHEEGHLDHGREFAGVLATELKALPSAADCAALDAAVRARHAVLFQRYKQKDVEYDQRTAHGRTQGAVF